MGFTNNFVALAFIACFDVILYLGMNSFPVEILRYGIDGSCDSGVLQVRMVPCNDSSLETCRYDDLSVDGVYRDVSKYHCSESVIGGVLL